MSVIDLEAFRKSLVDSAGGAPVPGPAAVEPPPADRVPPSLDLEAFRKSLTNEGAAAEASAVDLSLEQAVDGNPDERAQAEKLGAAESLPPDIVEQALPDYIHRQQVRQAKQELQDRPATSQFMAQPENARVAWDDVSNLAAVEKAAKAYTAAHDWSWRTAEHLKTGALNLRNQQIGLQVFSNFRNNATDLEAVRLAQAGIEKAQADPELTEEQRAKKIQHFTDRKNYHEALIRDRSVGISGELARFNANRAEREAIPQNPIADAALRAGSIEEFFHWFKKDPVGVIAQIGVVSLPNMAPGLLLGTAGGTAAGPAGFAAGMGTGSALVEYAASLIDQVEQHGGDFSKPETVRQVVEQYGDEIMAAAGQRGAIVGSFDAATAFLAALRLLPRGTTVGQVVAWGAAELGLQTTLQMAGGAGGEAAAEVAGGEDIRPGEILAEAVGELVTGPIEVAAGSLSVAQDAVRVNNVERNGKIFQAMGDSAKASKVRERLPDKYRQFVEKVRENGPVKSVYVNPEALTTLMQSGVIDPKAVGAADLPARIEEARQTGQSVEFSLEDYQTYIAGTEAGQALMGDIKFTEDDFTANEADRFNQEYRSLVEAELRAMEARAEEDRKAQSPFDRIYTARVAQLTAAGASPSAAAAQAKLHEAHARALAARYGVDPESMAAGVEIRGPLPESIANPVEPLDLVIERARRGVEASDGKLFGESLQEMARRLGIRDDRGDLASQDIDKNLRPFERKMLRESGGTLNDLLEAAVESGYFPQTEDDTQALSEDQLIQALLGPPLYVEGRGDKAELDRQQAAQDLIETLTRLGIDLNATNEEIKASLAEAAQVEGGQTFDQRPQDISAGPDGRTMLFDRDLAHWRQQAGRILSGRPMDRPLTLGRAFYVLREMGVTSGAVTLDYKVALGIRRKHPDIPRAVWDSLPELIADPLYVYPRRDGTTNVVIDAVTSKGEPVIVGLRGGDIRTITPKHTMEGEPGSGRMLNELVRSREAGNGVYVRDKSALDELHSFAGNNRRRGAVAGGTTRRGRTGKIVQREDVIKGQGRVFYQPEGGAGSRGSIQFFPDRTVINLGESADLSTFLHESGHLFVRILAGLAETNEMAAADLAAMMAFVGVETVEAFNQVEAQEKLARAFEAYLREGKAPSVDLQGAFARYRAWLINIYRSILGLDVAIDDSIRGVFDRMLATDDEIQAAQEINKFVADAGIAELMSDTERAAYAEAAQVATDQAVFQLEKAKIDELAREETERWKAEAEELRVELAAQVDALPVYRVIDEIRDPDSGVYLSREAVISMVGKEGARALPSGLTRAKGGTHPDFVASDHGFTSGDEMLFALMNAAKNKPARAALVKGMVEDQMRERHGSLNDNTAQAAERASEIVHSDERGMFLAMELRALARASNGQATPASVAKAAAVRIVASKKVKDAIQLGRYAAAEVAAAKAATRALLKKDIKAAAEAKRQQLLNHYLFMEARKARDELDAMLRYFHRFDKPSKGLDAAYAEQIQALLERYDFRRAVSLKEIGRRKSLAAFVAEQNDADQPVSIDDKLLLDARRQHYKDTSLEELRGLRDAVKHLDHLGRLKNKLLSAQAKRDLDDLVGEMVGSIEENWKGKTRKRTQSLTPMERRLEWWQSKASLRRIEFMLRELDGFKPGPMQETVFGIVAAADDNLQERRAGAAAQIKQLFAPFEWREVKAFFTRKTFIPEIGDSLTHESILAVALNMGTLDNREKLMKGTGWSDAGLDAVLAKMTAKDWALVQGIWDYLETFWPETVDLDKATKGAAAPKVEAVSFETAHGTMRGGYYPLKYDTRASDRALRNSTEDIYKRMMMGDIGRPTTNQGRTKERLAPTQGLKVRLDLGVFFEAVDETMHDLAFRKAAIDVTKILNHPKLVDALKDTVGEPRVDMLRDWLKDAIAGDMTSIATPADKVVAFIRNRATIMAMGYKLSTALLQPFGFTQTMARFIEDAGIGAGLTYAQKGLRAFYGSPAKMQAAVQFVRERSSFMRTRALTWDRDVHSAVKGLKKGPLSYYEASFFWHIAKMQLAVDYPTWLGAYHWSLDNQPEKGETAAAAYADSVVRMTQGAGSAKDLAPIQKGTELTKTFTMFMTYFSAMNNMLIDQARQLRRNLTPAQAAVFSANIFLLTIVPSVLVEALYSAAGVAGPDDDESWGEYLGKAWIMQLVGGLPIIRDWLSHVAGGFPYEMSPVSSIVKKAVAVTDQINQGELDRAAVNAALTAAGLVSPVPIPTGEMMIVGDYFVDFLAGEKDGFNPVEAFVRRDYRK